MTKDNRLCCPTWERERQSETDMQITLQHCFSDKIIERKIVKLIGYLQGSNNSATIHWQAYINSKL